MTAFPGVEFETEEIIVLLVAAFPCFLTTEVDHASVVARENDQGVVRQSLLLQGASHFSHDPVQLVHKIAIATRFTGPLKPGMRREGVVDVGRRKIQEERFVLVCLNPIYRFASEGGADLIIVVELMGFFSAANLIDISFFLDVFGLGERIVDEGVIFIESDHAVVFDIHKRRVAVYDGHTEIIIESEFQWSGLKFAIPVGGLFAETEVPFANTRRGIAVVLHNIRHRFFVLVDDQSHFKEHWRPVIGPEGVFSGE